MYAGKKMDIARVSFKGNKEKLYDYFNVWPVVKPGCLVVVSRGDDNASIGRVEELVPFEKRNELCCESVVMPVVASGIASSRYECNYEAKRLVEIEEEDLLS